MILLEILEAIDIPVLVRKDQTGLKFLGSSPDLGAELAWDEDRVVVWTPWAPSEWVRAGAIDGILHEALHGMLGLARVLRTVWGQVNPPYPSPSSSTASAALASALSKPQEKSNGKPNHGK